MSRIARGETGRTNLSRETKLFFSSPLTTSSSRIGKHPRLTHTRLPGIVIVLIVFIVIVRRRREEILVGNILPPCCMVMYVCMVTHIARVWINRVRLPTLHVVS